jgi:predicted transcriptional regulator of viral defense system
MRATDAFRELQALGRPIVETGEAQARLRMSSTTVAKLLTRLEAAGQIQRLGRGLWLIDKATDPAAAAPYLTRPFPAYVSLWSALSRYGMIEQLPKQIFVISLDRPRTIETSIGVYSIHHVVPEVFGGYVGDDQSGFFAVPEKALFDSVYLPSAQRLRSPRRRLLDPANPRCLASRKGFPLPRPRPEQRSRQHQLT